METPNRICQPLNIFVLQLFGYSPDQFKTYNPGLFNALFGLPLFRLPLYAVENPPFPYAIDLSCLFTH